MKHEPKMQITHYVHQIRKKAKSAHFFRYLRKKYVKPVTDATTLPEPTNGSFANQEEFRKFVTENQNGRWNFELHSRPLWERLADYKDDTIADAFPLLFPFGYTRL